MKFSAKHVGITCVLFLYFAAVFYLAPIFAPTVLEPTISKMITYFVVTYGLATFCTYFSRLVYVKDIGYRFELIAGLLVAFVFFGLIGPPKLLPKNTGHYNGTGEGVQFVVNSANYGYERKKFIHEKYPSGVEQPVRFVCRQSSHC